MVGAYWHILVTAMKRFWFRDQIRVGFNAKEQRAGMADAKRAAFFACRHDTSLPYELELLRECGRRGVNVELGHG